VTNDIDSIVRELIENGSDLGLGFVYRDSDGNWDGVLVADGRFHDFVPLLTRDATTAARNFKRLFVDPH
jgi:hypothetical protein